MLRPPYCASSFRCVFSHLHTCTCSLQHMSNNFHFLQFFQIHDPVTKHFLISNASDGHVSNVQASVMFSCYTKILNLKSTGSRKALKGNEMCYCERLTPLMPHCQSAQQVTVQSLSALPHWWVSNYVETDRGPLCSAAHCLAVPFRTQWLISGRAEFLLKLWRARLNGIKWNALGRRWPFF